MENVNLELKNAGLTMKVKNQYRCSSKNFHNDEKNDRANCKDGNDYSN